MLWHYEDAKKYITARLRWVEHKGKQILFIDYSDLKGECD